MKALVLKDIHKLDYETNWNQPPLPEGWAMVNVKASGICGSDLPRIYQTGAYHHPLIPGHEFSGIITESGSSEYQPGTPVAVLPIIPCRACSGCQVGPFHCTYYDFIGSRRDGGYAEYCAVPTQNLFRLPDGFNLEEGAFIEPIAVTLHVLRRSGMKPGSSVLVFGGGAIGILTAQWAKILGASKVILADIRQESLQIAETCGIVSTVNPLADAFKDIGTFDYIYEAAGSTQALLSAIQAAEDCATLTIVGREVNEIRIPIQDFEKMMRKELTLKGCWGYDLDQDTSFLYKILEEKQLVLSPMITHRVQLQEGPEIIEKMWKKEFYYCKVMFIL